jgi:hypothetical protein
MLRPKCEIDQWKCGQVGGEEVTSVGKGGKVMDQFLWVCMELVNILGWTKELCGEPSEVVKFVG